jgi:hypothetical protein
MDQKVYSVHHTDSAGNPTGGNCSGIGISIRWQNGPIREVGDQNGAFVEGVINAATDRLEFYQQSKFNCIENEKALGYLHKALVCLNMRTSRRTHEGVEGLHELGSLERGTA